MVVRLGDIMVERGLLTDEQRQAIIEHQRLNPRPFGLLAEEMFGVNPRAVERAWAAQYAQYAPHIDPAGERATPEALSLVDARQAWQFGVLPLRIEQDELVVATTEDRLARALRFCGWRIPMGCRFVLAEEEGLFTTLARHYPMAGLNAASMRTLRLANGW